MSDEKSCDFRSMKKIRVKNTRLIRSAEQITNGDNNKMLMIIGE